MSNMHKLRLFTPKDPAVKLLRREKTVTLQFEDAVEPWDEVREDAEDINEITQIPEQQDEQKEDQEQLSEEQEVHDVTFYADEEDDVLTPMLPPESNISPLLAKHLKKAADKPNQP